MQRNYLHPFTPGDDIVAQKQLMYSVRFQGGTVIDDVGTQKPCKFLTKNESDDCSISPKYFSLKIKNNMVSPVIKNEGLI